MSNVKGQMSKKPLITTDRTKALKKIDISLFLAKSQYAGRSGFIYK